MGWTPKMVNETGLWEFTCAIDGWNKAHSSGEDDSKPPTPEEHDERVARFG